MYNYYDIFHSLSRYEEMEEKRVEKRIKKQKKQEKHDEVLALLNTQTMMLDAISYLGDYVQPLMSDYEDIDGLVSDYESLEYYGIDHDGKDTMLEWIHQDFTEYMYEGWEQDIHLFQNEHGTYSIENVRNAAMLVSAADWYISAVYPDNQHYEVAYLQSLKQKMADTLGGLVALAAHAIVTLKDVTSEDASKVEGYSPLPSTVLHTISSMPELEKHRRIINNISSLEIDINSLTDVVEIIRGDYLFHELCGAASHAVTSLARFEDYDPHFEENLFHETKKAFTDTFMKELSNGKVLAGSR